MLQVNDAITLRSAEVRCQSEGASKRWRLRSSLTAGTHFAIAAKLDESNRWITEFYLLRMAEHAEKWIPLPARPDSMNPLSRQRHGVLADMFGRPSAQPAP
ncbi:hypothetical protein [Duganella phyllosphaerae]|uniref:Uncharacterized protein n=1 Tax=Duganella phyllosphaerae TaxID=762836 RepID=A0A1E7WH90_9BURK|nr:hypothetical protein [Duganella phyllosphaerae]OEZ97988.1 hypothetical protein DUPY_32590 [Duganella phyllosphaerae]